MKKLIAAALLVNLSGIVSASEIERLKTTGLAPITLEAIKGSGMSLPELLPLTGNKGINVVITNTNVNNGSSSVNTNVNVNNSAVNSPGNDNISVAVNNTNTNNTASAVNTHVNVHNTGVNSPGNDNINVGVNNNSAHNALSNANTDVNVHNANGNSPGNDNIGVAVNNNSANNGIAHADTDVNVANTDNNAFTDDNINVNIGNANTGNAISDADVNVTVNGTNANAGKAGVYKSPVIYRFKSHAQQAMNKALNNLNNMKNVQVLSKKITECSGSGFSFEVRFRSTMVLRTHAAQESFYCASKAEEVMYRKVGEFQNLKRQIVSAEITNSGFNYSYIIAYFPAK
ncbi:MAG: hypothetical protein HY796_00950 [Elusimicrobia bacterium]|nr:hypothetical protein [Elusimicrobiota bacterium]